MAESTAVGIAGLVAPAPRGRHRAVRSIPRRSLPPRAVPARSRGPGSGRARRLGRRRAARRPDHRLRRASAVGVSSTLFRPALVALLPSLARTPRASDRRERGDLHDREPRHPDRPARRRRARRFADVAASSRSARPRWSCRPACSPACRRRSHRRAAERDGSRGLAGFRRSATFRARGCSSPSSPRRHSYAAASTCSSSWPPTRCCDGARRGRPLTAAIGAGGLLGARRRGVAARRAARAAVRLGARLLGPPDHADGAAPATPRP